MSEPSALQNRREAFDRLTPREKEALRRTAAGETAKEVGRAMGISHRTVHNYQQEAARKLGVSGSVRAARLLLEHEHGKGVDVHPAPETLAAEPEHAVPPGSSEPSPAAVAPFEQTGSAPAGSAASAGRMIRTSSAQVLRDILAWGLGLSLIAVAAAEIYRISP